MSTNVLTQTRATSIGRDFLLVMAGSFFLALVSQLSIPLWFTPVPITMQTAGVFLIGALYGSRLGALTVVTFLLEGALGLPVFANFNGGLSALFGSTGGYLFGFIACAFFVGLCLENNRKLPAFSVLLTLVIGNALIYIPGLAWLAWIVGFKSSLVLGFYPFLIGDGIKLLFVFSVLSAGRKLIAKFANCSESSS